MLNFAASEARKALDEIGAVQQTWNPRVALGRAHVVGRSRL